MVKMTSEQGYTLVELMFTIALVLVLTLVTIPPVMKALERREALSAAQYVLDMVEFAKVHSAARNKAYYIVPSLPDQNENKNGKITINEGATSACTDGPMGKIQKVQEFVIEKSFPYVYLIGTYPDTLSKDAICVKPDGRVLNAATQMPFPSSNNLYMAGEARIEFQRFVNGSPDGPIHVVVIPFNGAGRLEYR